MPADSEDNMRKLQTVSLNTIDLAAGVKANRKKSDHAVRMYLISVSRSGSIALNTHRSAHLATALFDLNFIFARQMSSTPKIQDTVLSNNYFLISTVM